LESRYIYIVATASGIDTIQTPCSATPASPVLTVDQVFISGFYQTNDSVAVITGNGVAYIENGQIKTDNPYFRYKPTTKRLLVNYIGNATDPNLEAKNYIDLNTNANTTISGFYGINNTVLGPASNYVVNTSNGVINFNAGNSANNNTSINNKARTVTVSDNALDAYRGSVFRVISNHSASEPAPTLTTTARNLITDLRAGQLIWNSDSLAYEYYNGSLWKVLGSGSGGGAYIPLTGTEVGSPVTGMIETSSYNGLTSTQGAMNIGVGNDRDIADVATNRAILEMTNDATRSGFSISTQRTDLDNRNATISISTDDDSAVSKVEIWSVEPFFKGLEGRAYYGVNYTPNTYAQVRYVDSAIAANAGAGTVTSVTASSPLISSGGATPNISMPAATNSVDGYLTSTDWSTFNNKLSTATAAATYYPLTGGNLNTGAFIGFPKLSTQPATPATGWVNAYFDSTSRFSYVNASNLRRTYSMPHPSNQLWRFPYKANGGTVADSADVYGSRYYIRVEDYGAVASIIADQSTPVQAAFNAAATLNKAVLLSGIYKVTGLTVPAGVRIFGINDSLTGFYTNSNAPVLNVKGSNVILEKFLIYGDSTGGSTSLQTGVRIDSIGTGFKKYNIQINKVRFKGLNRGFYGENNGYNGPVGMVMSDCYFDSCSIGLWAGQRFEYNTMTANSFTGGGISIYIQGGNNTINGFSIINSNIGVFLKKGLNDSHSAMTGGTINGCLTYCIYVDSIANGYTFTGVEMYGTPAAPIYCVASDMIKFNGCTFRTQSSVSFINCTNTDVINNRFITSPSIVQTGSTVRFANNTWVAGAPSGVNDGIITKANSTNGTINMTVASNGGATIRPNLGFRTSRGAIVDGFTTVVNGDLIGDITSSAADGAAFRTKASIQFTVDGTVSSDVVPTSIGFSTTATTGARVERMKLSSAGILSLSATPATNTATSPFLVRNASTGNVEQITNTLSTKARYTASGTGVATTISFAHGLTGITSASIISLVAKNAASGGFSYVTTDATNVNVVYTVAPANGSNNLSFDVFIKP
jgi:hypothetical protein